MPYGNMDLSMHAQISLFDPYAYQNDSRKLKK